jgi:outer membrane receptor protein involved in Fe transport
VKRYLAVLLFICGSIGMFAQSVGVAGTVGGSIVDPTGAVIRAATVTLENDFSHYSQSKVTDEAGKFLFTNVPPDRYHLIVSAAGFELSHTDIVVRSKVPLDLKIALLLATHSETVQVQGDSSVDIVPLSHSSIGEGVFNKLPSSSVAAGLSDIITMSTPGVVADSNGFFHPLGDHAQMSFSVDNQPITDQQGYIFSTQLPPNAIQSLDAIFGAPPAEYGDKTSLVVTAITRSGLGQNTPHGDFQTQYGSFGTVGQSASLGYGNDKIGNFTALNWSRSGRFMDTPEFRPLHDIGNNANLFDRFDLQPSQADALHLNLFLARSWFQIPNTYDQQSSGQDQRQQVRSFDIAPGWVHTFSPTTLLTVNPYYRQDLVGYYPSASELSDQPATMRQNRRLTNFGLKADVSYAKGKHNAKAGVQINQTNLFENFQLGITDPAFNPVCVSSDGSAVTDPSITNPNACATAGYQSNPNLAPGLIPYDLTRGGSLFQFHQGAQIKEQAAFVQDTITLGHFTLSPGLRFDRYDGLSKAIAWEPRLGLAYQVRTGTVLRVSYSRSLETPFNENLVLSSATGAGGLATNVFGAAAAVPLQAGRRNQFNAGFQQSFGRKFVLDGDYFWKYTHNAYDLDTLLTTALVFPIEWRKSKMDGFSAKLTMAQTKGFSFFTTLGHTRARIYGPEVGGIIFNQSNLTDVTVQRVDHDQALQSTTHFQYQLPKRLPWVALTWRFDSGIVSNAVPDLASLLTLTADQQQMIGFYCGSQVATISNPITACNSNYGAKLVNIPAAGTENDDKNPARVKPRNLFDLGVGSDDLFHTERVKWTGRFTVLNLTNKVALYNFLSTCAGTHFVEPRSLRAEFGVTF